VTCSETRCNIGPKDPKCVEGVFPLISPLGPGLTLAHYVRTFNFTRIDDGAERHEWFTISINPAAAPVAAATPCWAVAQANGSRYLQVRKLLTVNIHYFQNTQLKMCVCALVLAPYYQSRHRSYLAVAVMFTVAEFASK
jgi:hypothetical protein